MTLALEIGNALPKCPICENKMEYVFQIASKDLFDVVWGDAGIGHITQCFQHRDILTFGWDGC